ncbi:PqiB family protein [Pseudomonas matsuisoli]|uniref:Mammalian cell entry protein n=1 Tax=Pseudomonas matsuisoli TaxID=1515666 RepID=A0A917PY39_9PSED|nr:MlaD family protein [Pseudomonas matsuisoli]GGJ98771.1 mammalian cell entry protein [Pseudomonas matsuisoli]
MSDRPESPTPGTAEVKSHRFRISLIWLVPIAAGLVGLSMVVHSWLSTGPQITVSFQTAEGLEANRTQVKYKNVVIGTVTRIQLSDDRSHVSATIELDESAYPFTRKDSRFWVVRPRIGAGGVSGIDTLLSGVFIGADAGREEETTNTFEGLEAPPPVTYGDSGKRFTLHTSDLGSLYVGAPVYYRRIQVGQVVSYALSKDGKGVDIEIFVNSPNDRFVITDSRFWNASGVDVALGADGLRVNTESLSTIVAGGIAFREPNWSPDPKAANEDTEFELFANEQNALAPPDGEPRYIQMRFDQSLRGMRVDAPVEFLGINVGRVVSMNLEYDDKSGNFPTVIGAVIYPQRLGRAHEELVNEMGGEGDEQTAKLMKRFIDNGLRAQARTGNLLTGQLYIALEFDANAPKVAFNPTTKPIEIPTVAGSFDRLQEQLQAMVDKISRLPVDEIGNNLNGSLAELQRTMKQVNGQVLPEMQGTLKKASETLEQVARTMETANQTLAEDSPQLQQVETTMDELQRTARSMRVLTDYLSRHPEALIRGRSGESAPGSYDPPTPSRTIEEQ